MILSSEDQELVRRVWSVSQARRLEGSRSGNWMNVFNLLPSSTQTELMIFGESGEAGSEGSVLRV